MKNIVLFEKRKFFPLVKKLLFYLRKLGQSCNHINISYGIIQTTANNKLITSNKATGCIADRAEKDLHTYTLQASKSCEFLTVQVCKEVPSLLVPGMLITVPISTARYFITQISRNHLVISNANSLMKKSNIQHGK